MKPDALQPSDVAETGQPQAAPEQEKTVKEQVAGIAAAVGDKVGDLAQAVADKLSDWKDAASDTLDEAADKLSDWKDAAAEKVSAFTDNASEKLDQAADGLEEKADQAADKVGEVAQQVVNYGEKTLAELTGLFQRLMSDEDRVKKAKEAEAIKSAFYKKLSKEKAEAGLDATVEDAAEEPEQTAAEEPAGPFAAIEQGFKSLYNKYRQERAEYNRQQEQERADNLVKKQAIIEELKTLVEKQEDVSSAFPAFRELQNRWRETGPVPATDFRNVNDTYQFYVEQFYDKVQLNRDLRDLDFKKNLEVKEKFCEEAEHLAEDDNVVDAFKELQKLHEQWKEYGPVAKEYRDAIWDRFKAATAVINKKYQAYFEGQKAKFAENLEAKTKLCEQVEAIAAKEEIKTSNEWNELSKQIEALQQEWRGIGFASRKENQRIYDRFRAACDKFYERKRLFYNEFKDSMNANMDKKMALIEKAEALKDSTEWKKTADAFIELQKQWKEIGAVPRKKSEQLWKRFRAACDAFFTERDKQARPENDFYGNLKAKKALVEEILAFESDDEQLRRDAAATFAQRWQDIGFVPFKEKEAITKAYRDAMKQKFPEAAEGRRGGNRPAGVSARPRGQRAPMTEKDRLVQEYNRLQQEIDTYENNIGFFAASKNSAPLISQMQEKIAAAKQELKDLEGRIRAIEDAQEEQ